MTSRKKPGVAFWATVVVVVVLVAYPLSFGPACWITSRTGKGAAFVPTAYRPILWGLADDPSVEPSMLDRAINWYASAGAATSWQLTHDLETLEIRWEQF